MYSAIQYPRKFSLVVANDLGQGLDFADFKCTFEIHRGDSQTPNSAEIRVMNLSDATAKRFVAKEFTQIVVQAGYPANFGQIFQGTIKQSRLGRLNQKDSYVDITAADADAAYNFATVNASIPAGNSQSTVAEILQSAASRFGATKGNTPQFSPNGATRGQVVYGALRDVCRDFAFENTCSWSIQDSALTFIPLNGYVAGNPIVISPETGLIGTPEQIAGGISFKTLLNPNIKIGSLIRLQTPAINQFRFSLESTAIDANVEAHLQNKLNADGLYYTMVAEHIGDTRGEEWYTSVIALSVDATITDPGTASRLFAIPPINTVSLY